MDLLLRGGVSMKWGFPALAAIAALPGLTVPSPAAVHRVPSEYPTIQAGVDACAVGDTVLVAPGIYTGPGNRGITISGIDIVVRSEAGPEATIIDAESQDRGFELTGPMSRDSRIEGFTIRNGVGYSGGAIYSWRASPTLADLQITDCRANGDWTPVGGGLGLFQCSPAIYDVELRNGWAGAGAGMACQEIDSILMSNVRFYDHSVDALYCTGIGSLRIEGCEFRGNEWGSDVRDCTAVLIENSLFSDQRLGIRIDSDSCVIAGCTLFSNEYYDLYFEHGSLRLEGSTLVGQHSVGGAAVELHYVQSAGLTNTLISNVVGTGVLWDGQGETPAFECCNVYGCDDGNYSGNLDDPTGENGNISAYPFFCGSDGPGEPFSLEVRENSPCLPENNSCGVQIGAYGCGCPAITAAEAAGARGPRLFPVHPNPFNPRTTIAFELPEAMLITLRILDIAGRTVVSLVESRSLPAGRHEISWDGQNGAGFAVASGIYLCRVEAEGHRQVGKLTLLR